LTFVHIVQQALLVDAALPNLGHLRQRFVMLNVDRDAFSFVAEKPRVDPMTHHHRKSTAQLAENVCGADASDLWLTSLALTC
jgi:hypothetical protein